MVCFMSFQLLAYDKKKKKTDSQRSLMLKASSPEVNDGTKRSNIKP